METFECPLKEIPGVILSDSQLWAPEGHPLAMAGSKLNNILYSFDDIVELPSGLEWLQFRFDGSPGTAQLIVAAALADLEAKIKNYGFDKNKKKLLKKKIGRKMSLSVSSSGALVLKHSPRDLVVQKGSPRDNKSSPRDSSDLDSPRSSPKAKSTTPRSDEGSLPLPLPLTLSLSPPLSLSLLILHDQFKFKLSSRLRLLVPDLHDIVEKEKEFNEADTRAKLMNEARLNLLDTLAHPVLKKVFRDHLTAARCLENLDFYEQV